jgi:hypothetical protein
LACSCNFKSKKSIEHIKKRIDCPKIIIYNMYKFNVITTFYIQLLRGDTKKMRVGINLVSQGPNLRLEIGRGTK